MEESGPVLQVCRPQPSRDMGSETMEGPRDKFAVVPTLCKSAGAMVYEQYSVDRELLGLSLGKK